MAPKTRLDAYVVECGWAPDLSKARAMILAGEVRLRGAPAKAGSAVADPSTVTVHAKPQFVSRAGDKLDAALSHFGIDVSGLRCLDVGASTGGFTQVLLRRGAASVWAIDVGRGLLDSALRRDPRVHLLEGVNFRLIDQNLVTEAVNLAVVDVSFISLGKIVSPLKTVLQRPARVVALVKPQFEGTPQEVPGGFVRDETTREAILQRVAAELRGGAFSVDGRFDSPVKGRKGNQETFFLLKHP